MFITDAIKELRDLAAFYLDRGQKERSEAYDHAALIVSKVDGQATTPAPPLAGQIQALTRKPGDLLGGPKALKIEETVVRCKKCGHQWTPRGTRIFRCAKCKSPYWNIETVEKDGKKGA